VVVNRNNREFDLALLRADYSLEVPREIEGVFESCFFNSRGYESERGPVLHIPSGPPGQFVGPSVRVDGFREDSLGIIIALNDRIFTGRFRTAFLFGDSADSRDEQKDHSQVPGTAGREGCSHEDTSISHAWLRTRQRTSVERSVS